MSLPVRAFSVCSCVSAIPMTTLVLLLATGCGVTRVSDSSVAAALPAVISGRVHGGQQPVSGASIQLYAANTTTNMGASTALLTQPVTSLSDGSFSITGLYSCPASNPLVYIVATGGNPGLGVNATNSSIAMLSLLGSCNTLLTNAATTYIFIDELTTVTGVQALAPFMSDYAHVGSAASSINGVGGAFETATSEIDFSTGMFENGVSDQDLPEVTLNTLADIIGACINTAGGSGPCTTLFAGTGGTSNTIAAALAMATAPGTSTTALYNLITANPPFQPYFTSVPTDFTATVGYTVPSFIQAGTLDSNGQIWLYFGGYDYNTATDTSTDSAGYIAVYDNNFNQLFTVSPGTGGLYYPTGLVPDASGHMFAINANNSISEFSSTGAALSPAAGWPTGLSSTFSPTGAGNNYITNANQGGPIAVDALGNIWGGTPYSSAPGSCYFELNSSGSVITPTTGTFCTVTGDTDISTAALDGAGDAWVLGEMSIAKVSAQGGLAATAPTSQGCFYPDSNVYTSSNIEQAIEGATQGLAYDHVHGQVWGFSETGAGTITDAGAAVFCQSGSTTLPVLQAYGSTLTTPGAAYSAGSILISNAVLDGAGNLWFVTGGVAAKGVVGSAANTFTGTVNYQAYLGEISSSGALLTPYNASTQTYGLQPAGFGVNATASVTNGSVYPGGNSVALLGVDRFGNIWATDYVSNKLLKITGLAAANTVNY
jgi:hypothetical protein